MTGIFAFSDKGCALAKKISSFFKECECYTTKKFAASYKFSTFISVCHTSGELFSSSKTIIFVGACGIAVRAIAPYVKSKITDPAVLVIDECGTYVISLLSGHIGGANALAKYISDKIGAVPVITTATDVNGRFSIDAWAAKHALYISSMKIAKVVSAEILTHNILFKSDFVVNCALPDGLVYGEDGRLGIYVTYKKAKPFENTLRLVPKVIHVGVGCRRGTAVENIDSLLTCVLDENNIDINAVLRFASIDLKKDEAGLHTIAEKYGVPIVFYEADRLNTAAGKFTSSEFVKSITGVDNVCERAAALSSGGDILVHKTAKNGVTVAMYIEKWGVESFDV